MEMKKEVVYVLILLAMLFGLVACDGGEETAEPAEAPAQAEELSVEEAAEAEQEAVEEPTAEAVQEEAQAEAVEPTEEEVAQEEAAGEEQPATEGEAAAVQPPPMDDPNLMPIEQFQMYVDDLPVEGWGKTIAAGAALEPAMGPSNNGFPPFIFVDFSSPGDDVIPDPTAIFTMDVPQGRVFAVAPYLAMYDEGSREYAQEAVSGLQQILEERPESLDDKLPTLPGFGDAQQGVRGTPAYIEFDGGSGVGFVAGYGQEVGPLLNDTLVYQFVGLTETRSDTPFGTQYLSFVFPLEANFLSDLESVTEEEIAEAEADLTAYLAGKTEQINGAADTDFTPNLSAINTAMQSITVNAREEAADAGVGDAGSAAAYEPTLLDSPCYFIMPEGLNEEDVTCGMVEMPMNRDEPDGAMVHLPYAIVKSTNPEPRPDAFLYLVGGPGGSIVNRLTGQYHEWAPFRAEHDLIFYNQRGTILTDPYIECAQYTGGIDFEDSRADIEAQMPEAWRPVRDDTLALPACLDLYREKGVDFTQYNSLTNAQDTADLMQALGYDEYNLYGLSYGTRLALSIMRDRPDLVRAVILDSNFPPNLDTMNNTASIGYEAGLQLFKECAETEVCSAAFPNLEARFVELRKRLAEEPLVTDDEFVPQIGEIELINFLMNAGANPRVLAYVPLAIDQLEKGDSDVYLRLMNRELPLPEAAPEDAQPAAQAPPERDFDYAEMNELSNDYEAAVRNTEGVEREQSVQTQYEFTKQIMQGSSREQLMAFTENFPPETAADLQQRLEVLSDDGVATMLSFFQWDFVAHSDTSDLVNLLVNCYDDYNFSTYDEATAPNVYDLPDELLESDRESNRDNQVKCSLIPSGRGPEWMIEPVSSDLPVLIFQGLADNNTPPSWSAVERPTLSSHYYVEVPASPHGVIQMGECITDISQDFLNDPAQEPDSSCVVQYEPDFVTEAPPTSP